MKIIVSGGGTGGHIYPAVTLIRTIQQKVKDLEVLYVGTRAGLEADIIPKEGFPFATVDIRGFERHLTLVNFKRAGKAMWWLIPPALCSCASERWSGWRKRQLSPEISWRSSRQRSIPSNTSI